MDYSRVIEKANEMQYKFLFFTPEYQESFFENIDKNLVLESAASVFFIDRSGDVPEVFWGAVSMQAAIDGLEGLKDHFNAGTKLLIRYGEDKASIGSLADIVPHFVNSGLILKSHTIGYKSKELKIISDFPAVTTASANEKRNVMELIDRAFGIEDFGMEADELEQYIKDDDQCFYIIKRDNRTVGMALGSIYASGKTVFIRGLAVDEGSRGLGYSKQLMAKVFTWAQARGAENSMLWVEKSNITAIALYEKLGYFPYGDQEVKLHYMV